MALIPCPDCKKHISESADYCPNCGLRINLQIITNAKYQQKQAKVWLAIIGLILLVFFVKSAQEGKAENKIIRQRIEEQRRVEKFRNTLDDIKREINLDQIKYDSKNFDKSYQGELKKRIKQNDYTKYSRWEKDIYDYMQSIWDGYENIYGVLGAEDRVFESTANKYNISKEEVLTIFTKVDEAVFN